MKHLAKGLDDLIQAVSLLRRRSSDVALHLVGAGPEETALRNQIAALGLDRHVHFHGYVPMGPALNRHYDEADIFVFPSLSEGSPRAVLEALAHSLPVVSTDVGSVPELIEDGVSGLIVPTRNAHALADAVARFIQDDDYRNRCAKAGFAAAQHHTVENYVAPLAAKAAALARKGCETA